MRPLLTAPIIHKAALRSNHPGRYSSTERRDYLSRLPNPSDAREDVLDRIFVRLLGLSGAHRVLREYLLVSVFIGEPRGAFHADIRGNAAKDDGVYFPAPKLQIQLGTVESAPLPLGDDEVAFLRPELGHDPAPFRVRRRRLTRLVRDGDPPGLEVGRRRHSHQKDGHPVLAKRFRELSGILHDGSRIMGVGGPGHYARLNADDRERGRGFVDIQPVAYVVFI